MYVCEYFICRADLKRLGLKVVLELRVKEDSTVEVSRLELDVSLGEGKVSISVTNLLCQLHCNLSQYKQIYLYRIPGEKLTNFRLNVSTIFV